MTKKLSIYKCAVCGNVVEVVHEAPGALICCGSPMQELIENTVDASKEKHVPVAQINAGVVTVNVGSVPHPMEEKHYIEWIEIIEGAKLQRVHLKPGMQPSASFKTDGTAVIMREYCNLHGLWKGETK